MKKIQLAFYKGTKPINLFISYWTWLFNPKTPNYSHVEIGFDNDDYFSSTNRDESDGARWIKRDKLFKSPERWDIYTKEFDDNEILNMIERADSIEGSKYDWYGIFGFITPLGLINSKNKWYCSEACNYILSGIWVKRISPRRFYLKSIKSGFKPVYFGGIDHESRIKIIC